MSSRTKAPKLPLLANMTNFIKMELLFAANATHRSFLPRLNLMLAAVGQPLKIISPRLSPASPTLMAKESKSDVPTATPISAMSSKANI